MTQASKAMIVQEPQAEQPRALVQHSHAEQAILTREGLKLAAEQRELLKEYVNSQMIEGTDFGVIPGTKNKTLLKPGAEKLVELFRCTPKFTLLKEKEDYESGIFAYRFRVRLFQRDGQVVLAEGYGSCNSREARYRWRNAARKCPACGKEAIIKGKEEYGGGWLCFDRKGGCKAKFKDGDHSIEGQEQGQVENENIADVANTCLKMAKKRALVDGAISLARVSDLFTQDAEDGPPEDRKPGNTPAKKPPSRKAQSKGLPIWQQAVVIATDYGFDCGAGNTALWAFVKTIIGAKVTKDWTEDDLKKIEAALAEKTATVVPPIPNEGDLGNANMPEEDINF